MNIILSSAEKIKKELYDIKKNTKTWNIEIGNEILVNNTVGYYYDKKEYAWKVYINYKDDHVIIYKSPIEGAALQRLLNLIYGGLENINDLMVYSYFKY